MGTSTNYEAPASWADLKGQVTRAAHSGAASGSVAHGLISGHVSHSGGARSMSRSTGTGRHGPAARSVAGALAGFLSDVAKHGLPDALERLGLGDLAGRPLLEILDALLDKLGGPASTLDQVDARNALSLLQEDLLKDAETPEEVEEILRKSGDNLEETLSAFFGFYINEQFCRVFYEHLTQRLEPHLVDGFFKDILDYISAAIENRTVGRKLKDIDWSGSQGKKLVQEIMEDALKVFGE